jgi:hypothetical protein
VKRTNLIRLGGLAAMVGGVLYAALGLMTWLCIPNCPRSLGYIMSVFLVLLALGAMVAITALHILQMERYGWLGTLAFLVAFVGVALIFVSELPSLVNPGAVAPVELLWLFLIGLLVATIGIIAYGVVTLNAGVVAWWCGVALIAGNPLVGFFLYLFSPAEDSTLGVPWIVVGYAIFRAAARQAQQPSRVR